MSQAITHITFQTPSQAMTYQNKMKSVVLCGGKGVRMKAFVGENGAKHLLKICHETIIQRLLRQLFRAGVKEHILVVPRLFSQIRRNLDSLNESYGKCHYIETIGSKAGDLVNGLQMAYTPNTKVVVVMGDCVFIENEIIDFIQCDFSYNATKIIAGAVTLHSGTSGVFITGNVKSYTRKYLPNSIASAGIYLLHDTAVKFIIDNWDHIESSMFKLMDSCLKFGLKTECFIFRKAYDINTPETYQLCIVEIDS